MIPWVERIFRKFRKPVQARQTPTIGPEHSTAILRWLEMTQEEELSCGEVLERMGQFAELDLAGEDTAALLPLVKEHLKLCRDCRDEYEALVRVLQEKA